MKKLYIKLLKKIIPKDYVLIDGLTFNRMTWLSKTITEKTPDTTKTYNVNFVVKNRGVFSIKIWDKILKKKEYEALHKELYYHYQFGNNPTTDKCIQED